MLFFFLHQTNFHTVVQNFSDQSPLRHLSFFKGWYFLHILWLGSLNMEERNKDADLQHVHKLLDKSLTDHLVEIHGLVVQNFQLMLLDQK